MVKKSSKKRKSYESGSENDLCHEEKHDKHKHKSDKLNKKHNYNEDAEEDCEIRKGKKSSKHNKKREMSDEYERNQRKEYKEYYDKTGEKANKKKEIRDEHYERNEYKDYSEKTNPRNKLGRESQKHSEFTSSEYYYSSDRREKTKDIDRWEDQSSKKVNRRNRKREKSKRNSDYSDSESEPAHSGNLHLEKRPQDRDRWNSEDSRKISKYSERTAKEKRVRNYSDSDERNEQSFSVSKSRSSQNNAFQKRIGDSDRWNSENSETANDRNNERELPESESLPSDKRKTDSKEENEEEPLSKRQKIVNVNMRTGGAYIPPAKLRMMQENMKDKGSAEYQRIAWEALKKSIVGMTNKVNSSNIANIVPELFRENIIRGRGVLARAIMQAQSASPTFTRVYAALVAIINTKFPEIGELILKRLIIQYKRGFRRNDKTVCMTAARFLAHLLNQEVAHEVLILEMVTHLLETPTEDSVEVAIATLKECGQKLTLLTPRGMRAISDRVRDILHQGQVDVRVRYMIEVFFAIQKDGFKDFETIPKELDLVEEEDKYTHLLNLDDELDGQEMLNVFKFDPDYQENEEKYKSVVKEILGDSSDEEGSGDDSDDEEEEEDEETKDDESQQIIDMTETNVVCLRRKIYLTIQSSLDFEECAHKLLKLELKPGQILEMCYMILDCCAQQRTYEKFFGLLAQRFCQLNKVYVEPFTEIFENSYKTIHRLETNKLRNVAKFFAHLLYTDAISWMV
ncbi:Pre-mRNA-splicing factor CWC22-like protein, partial [Stegodyphus mimosarum]